MSLKPLDQMVSMPGLECKESFSTVFQNSEKRNNDKALLKKETNQMAPPARTITVALDMSKAFDTINIHTLIRKLLQNNIPGTNYLMIVPGMLLFATTRSVFKTDRSCERVHRCLCSSSDIGGGCFFSTLLFPWS